MVTEEEIGLIELIIEKGGLDGSFDDFFYYNKDRFHFNFNDFKSVASNYLSIGYIDENFNVTAKIEVRLDELKKKLKREIEISNLDIQHKIFETKLLKWQVKTFWWIFAFAVIGGGYAVFDIIDNLTKKEIPQEEIVTKKHLKKILSNK